MAVIDEATHEALRLKALRALQAIDSEPDKTMDYLVQNLARFLHAPICYISFIESDRQWFKAKYGIIEIDTPRSEAFCNLTIKGKVPLEISDLQKHPQLSSHKFTKAKGGLRYYLGIPLITDDGYSVGTLCIIDAKPRSLDFNQIMHMQIIASLIMALLTSRKDFLQNSASQLLVAEQADEIMEDACSKLSAMIDEVDIEVEPRMIEIISNIESAQSLVRKLRK